MISAAIRAPHVELWPQTAWTRWAPNLAMPLAFVLVTCGGGLRQPFTLGGKRSVDLDARTPGVAAVPRHPLFLALALWSGAHLLPNGDLAQVILFGAFAVMALAAIPAFDARARRRLGPDTGAFFAATAFLSPARCCAATGCAPMAAAWACGHWSDWRSGWAACTCTAS